MHPKYEEGMENLLYLSEIQKNSQIAITSILPELLSLRNLESFHVKWNQKINGLYLKKSRSKTKSAGH